MKEHLHCLLLHPNNICIQLWVTAQNISACQVTDYTTIKSDFKNKEIGPLNKSMALTSPGLVWLVYIAHNRWCCVSDFMCSCFDVSAKGVPILTISNPRLKDRSRAMFSSLLHQHRSSITLAKSMKQIKPHPLSTVEWKHLWVSPAPLLT